jgi:tetrahydromethanopterin S-methyltransferase subunit G
MNEDDIIKMINDEQVRVTTRKEEIEKKVNLKNQEYDELIKNKEEVGEDAKAILEEEKDIREHEKIV